VLRTRRMRRVEVLEKTEFMRPMCAWKDEPNTRRERKLAKATVLRLRNPRIGGLLRAGGPGRQWSQPRNRRDPRSIPRAGGAGRMMGRGRFPTRCCRRAQGAINTTGKIFGRTPRPNCRGVHISRPDRWRNLGDRWRSGVACCPVSPCSPLSPSLLGGGG
jgi:hypothetical protein